MFFDTIRDICQQFNTNQYWSDGNGFVAVKDEHGYTWFKFCPSQGYRITGSTLKLAFSSVDSFNLNKYVFSKLKLKG